MKNVEKNEKRKSLYLSISDLQYMEGAEFLR